MRTLLTGIAALLSAGPLAAQHHHPAPPAQAGQRPPAVSQCPGASAMSGGQMMPGMTAPGPMRTGQAGMMATGMSGTMNPALMDVMHRTILFAPERVLEQADALGLSADQRDQVQGLARVWATSAPESDLTELRVLLSADMPDVAAIRAAAERALASEVDHVAIAAAVRGVLSPEQRDQMGRAACDMMPR